MYSNYPKVCTEIKITKITLNFMGTLLWEQFNNFKLLFTIQSNLHLLETKSGKVQILGNAILTA